MGTRLRQNWLECHLTRNLGWSGPDKIMLERYLDKMLDAVRRSTYGAMQHLLIGMFWHVDGYEQKYLIKKFINMGPEFCLACRRTGIKDITK